MQVIPPLLYDGVTVIVAVTGTTPVFVAVNDDIFPVPFAARPMLMSSFVQLYTVPVTDPVNVTVAVGELLHTT